MTLTEFLSQAASDCVNARIRPEPIEAPEPQPVVERRVDRVRDRALRHGFNVATAEAGPMSLAQFVAGVDAYELYLSCHDRRAR